MKLDGEGIRFSTTDCRFDISITIGNLYDQVANLSGVECSTRDRLKKRLDDILFSQTLFLHDQCGKPVGRSIRSYPRLSVDNSECAVTIVDERAGKWDFSCTFPGSESATLQCQAAIKNDIVDFLLTDPFGGACPDLSTVITTLAETGQDFLSESSLLAELYNKGLTPEEQIEAGLVVTAYQQMWSVLQEVFSKTELGSSALQVYLDLYNRYRDFETDICEDLHAGEIPLNLSLRAGASRFPSITTLNFAPVTARPYNITIQDSAGVACCQGGSVANNDATNGTCSYPASAVIRDSGCICGRTVGGDSIAFKYTECENFVGECETDQDCTDGGNSGFVCLTGSCCGGGVCIDPYACSENGTSLVTYSLGGR